MIFFPLQAFEGGSEFVSKFINDPQTKSILVYQTSSSGEEDNVAENSIKLEYGIQLSVQFLSQKENAIVFIKRGSVIEGDKKIYKQVQMINLENASPFDTLHSYVSNAVSPFFKSYVKKSGKSDREGDKMVPSVEKKIAELEMSLLHLQQNIDIPEITLVIHPHVQALLKKAESEKRKVSSDDFADKLEDSSFLNALQNGVNRWIREIQKVYKN